MKAWSARAALAAALLTMLLPAAGRAEPGDIRSEQAGYVGTTVLTVGHGCDLASAVPEVPALASNGGACFDLNGNEGYATFWVNDVTERAIGGSTYFLAGGSLVESSVALFCETATVDVPEGATRMYISLDAAITPITCGSDSGVPTTGAIAVAFVLTS